jgi:hypothetical protein
MDFNVRMPCTKRLSSKGLAGATIPIVSPGLRRGGSMGFLFNGSIITVGSGFKVLGSGFRFLVQRFWVLGSGFEGFRLMVSGHWSLAAGHLFRVSHFNFSNSVLQKSTSNSFSSSSSTLYRMMLHEFKLFDHADENV